MVLEAPAGRSRESKPRSAVGKAESVPEFGPQEFSGCELGRLVVDAEAGTKVKLVVRLGLSKESKHTPEVNRHRK